MRRGSERSKPSAKANLQSNRRGKLLRQLGTKPLETAKNAKIAKKAF
jgi:hypothetical protein